MPYGMLVPCSMARCDLSQLQWPEFTVPPPVPNTLKEIKLPDAIALANWERPRAEKYFKLLINHWVSDGPPCEAKERETLAAQLNDTYKMVQSYNLNLEVDNITGLPNQALSMKSHQRE